MKVLILVLLAIALVGGPISAPAVTLQAGTYKLEWDAANGSEARFNRWSCGTFLMPLSDVKDASTKLPKLASSKALIAPSSPFPILLDESRGTGKGYDTLYIKHCCCNPVFHMTDAAKSDLCPCAAPQAPAVLDMTDAAKFNLVIRHGALELENGGDIRMDVKTDGVVRKLRLNVALEGDPRKATSMISSVTIVGGWYGTIKTDTGSIGIQTIDANANGIYSDNMPEKLAGGWDELCLVSSPDGTGGCGCREIALGNAIHFDDKLYSVDVSKSGDEVVIKPYSGGIGELQFDPRDNKGNKVRLDFLNFECPTSDLRFDGISGDRITLPADTYNSVWAVVSYADQAQAAIDVHRRMTVSHNSRTTITIGGPLKMSLIMATDKARAGSKLHIKFPIAAGKDRFAGLESWKPDGTLHDATIALVCTNAKGKRVSNDKLPVPWGWDTECYLFIEKQWKPGKYTLTAKLDAKPYSSSPVSVNKTIRVTR